MIALDRDRHAATMETAGLCRCDRCEAVMRIADNKCPRCGMAFAPASQHVIRREMRVSKRARK